MLAREHVWLGRADGEGAQHCAIWREDRRCGIRAAIGGGRERHTRWRKAIVLRCVVDHHRIRLEDGVLAGRGSARLLTAQEADARFEPDTAGIDEGDEGVGCATEACCKASDLIQCRVGQGIENFVLRERLEPLGFISLHHGRTGNLHE